MPTPQNAEQWEEFWNDCFQAAHANPRGELRSWYWSFKGWRGYRTAQLINCCLEGMMARGKSNAKPETNRTPGQWTQFVDISLAGVSQADIQKAFPTADLVVDALAGLLENGYRVSLSYNSQTDAFIASCTCKDETSPNGGKTFNSFAETWFEALQVTLFKHFVVTKTLWADNSNQAERPRFG